MLAQSIIEDKDDFACEECETCRRIKKNEYVDVYYIDGHSTSIKKEQIENLMDELMKTPLEAANKKIYIIDNINNSSPKVLNMILKFMEEPHSDNVYGIFISDNIDTLLETIVSRCQKIPFNTRDFSYLIKEYMNKGFEYIDAYLLCHIKHELVDVDTDAYNLAKEYVYRTIDNLSDKRYLPVLFSREFFNELGKDKTKEGSDYYLDIFLKILDDNINGIKIKDEEYNEYLERLSNYNVTKLFDILLKAKDKTNTAVNRNLLFDQIAAKIIL